MRFGQHCVKHSSNLQSTISLSSGESEYYGIVKGAACGLGMKSMLEDWSEEVEVEVLSDSSAARGHVQRRGLGRMRHIQTRFLWVQERIADKHMRICAVAGTKNPADILTKATSAVVLNRHLEGLHFREESASNKQKALS